VSTPHSTSDPDGEQAPAIDSAAFRRAAGQFLTGVTIVTVRAQDGTPLGLTANSFATVSLDPPLVLVCLGRRLGSFSAFQAGRAYAVHVLAEDQADLSSRFALKGEDKFRGLRWREGLDGVPILPDYLALWECRLVHAYEGGDHTIFVARVERLEVGDPSRLPLGFFRGKYIGVHRHPAAYVPEEIVELWGLGWA
jgi:3-hydroxy-9,10-secoandrosta-1,3,5(10)-triene-9,17-dione monooxygenase reductase component